MPGFTIVLNNTNRLLNLEIDTPSFFDKFKKEVNNFENVFFHSLTNNKFHDDKLFDADDDYFIGIDGFILNLRQLKSKYSVSDNFTLIRKIYKEDKKRFVNILKGDFCGFIYEKNTNKLTVFTNQTGTKRIFYYFKNNILIISSDFKFIVQILRNNSFDYCLDELGAYCLLSYGYMIKDITLINEIKKLEPGCLLISENTTMEIHRYYDYNNIEYSSDSKEKIISTIDELFSNAVELEYEKDLEYNYNHIATLSGGLDSRMNVMIAHQLGYKNQLNITFSQSMYYDYIIANKIANDLYHDFLFMSLDNGNSQLNLDQNFFLNDGLIFYSGAAHALFMSKAINWDDYGLLHTGMIGDANLGSFIKNTNKSDKPNPYDGADNKRIIPKINNDIDYLISSYKNNEIYLFYNRAFNGANNGYLIFELFTYAVSPFLEKEFLEYCISIPPEFKVNQTIYLEWIDKKHPEVAEYIWEKMRTKPKLGAWYKYYSLFKRAWDVFVTKNRTMNPRDKWYRDNLNLKNFIDSYMNDKINLLDKYPELYKDALILKNEGNFSEKTQLITLLKAFETYFYRF